MKPVNEEPLILPWVSESFERSEHFEMFTAHFRDVLVAEAIRCYALSGRGVLMCNMAEPECVAVAYVVPEEGQVGKVFGSEAVEDFENYDVLNEAMIGAFLAPMDDGKNEAWLKRFSRERVAS